MKIKNMYILAKTLAMALMAVMEVRTMIINAKTVGKIKRNLYSGADDEEGSEDKAVVRTRTSSGDIVYNKDSAEDEDNEQSSSSEQSKYSLETQRIIYGISCLS